MWPCIPHHTPYNRSGVPQLSKISTSTPHRQGPELHRRKCYAVAIQHTHPRHNRPKGTPSRTHKSQRSFFNMQPSLPVPTSGFTFTGIYSRIAPTIVVFSFSATPSEKSWLLCTCSSVRRKAAVAFCAAYFALRMSLSRSRRSSALFNTIPVEFSTPRHASSCCAAICSTSRS